MKIHSLQFFSSFSEFLIRYAEFLGFTTDSPVSVKSFVVIDCYC